jgi:hypothetical protein
MIRTDEQMRNRKRDRGKPIGTDFRKKREASFKCAAGESATESQAKTNPPSADGINGRHWLVDRILHFLCWSHSVDPEQGRVRKEGGPRSTAATKEMQPKARQGEMQTACLWLPSWLAISH